jgi:transcriptional regulator with XRE-family HTH domain
MSIADFDQKKFIKSVRAFMKKNNISVRKFAKLSGVAFPTLYRLEEGKSEITLATIRKLETAMKTYEVKL